MANEPHQWTLSWLSDAYLMERSITEVLENHVSATNKHPELHARVLQHLEETRNHERLVEECINRLGGSAPSIKASISTFMGQMRAVSQAGGEDEPLKDSISDYATEHFEMATYKAIMTAAEAENDPETVDTCRKILLDEEDMARFLDDHLAQVATTVVRS
ncbi:MAG TPA: DUF892 family protein [Thermomicrobiaceae bacterium]|nr:DUF892 family protein [Thermomicrobiaceae bacterium]